MLGEDAEAEEVGASGSEESEEAGAMGRKESQAVEEAAVGTEIDTLTAEPPSVVEQ